MNQQTTFPDEVILLVSYPKSGSTWLRFLIGNYLTNGQCDFTNYHQIVPDIHYNPEQLEKISDGPIKFIKSHWPFTPDSKKVIYIVRDGRDVALSYYFHFLRKGKQATWFFKEFLELFNTTSTLDKFTLWSHHVNEWLDNAPKDFMLVRYEDMQTNTNAELIRVLEFADIPVNQQTVTTAVEAAQFKRMQQLEKQQRSFDPTLAGSAPNQYAVRSGKVGESKSYFSDELMAQFIEVHGSALERLGYLKETPKRISSDDAQITKSLLVKSPAMCHLRHQTLKQGPDFIFIGGQKCGSTSMYNYLIEHPKILPATKKQVHFFDRYFDKGIDWYLAQFPAIRQDDITGEATPSYLFHPLVPQLVSKFLPEVKLIVVLRNPVDRLISHYNMLLRKNTESLSLEAALACEIERTQFDWNKIIMGETYDYKTYNRYSYLSRGIYVEQLKRWMTLVAKEQFIILTSEEFFRSPATILNQVFEFLGLSHYQLDEYIPYGKAVYPAISQSIRHTLAEFYRPYNQQLEEYLGMSFHWDSVEEDSTEINANLQNILVSYQQKRATMLTQLSAEKGSQKSLPILCESEKSGGDFSPKKIEGNLDLNNIVLTGIPRSGTTLTCYLLNKLPNTVALNEPIAYRRIEPLSNHQEMCAYICRFFEQMRDSIYHHKIAESKTVNGKITDNMASEQFGKGSTTREWVASSEDKKFFIEKELINDFLLIIKKPVIFTMVLEQLIQYFPVYAIIRNPLSVLASWSNVPLDIREGRSPAEKWDAMLARNLAQQPDRIARQLYLLSWYYEKYHRYLPTNVILRYEDIIASGGQTLSMITPKASQLNESLENKNLNQLYDRELMLVLGERLLKSEGAFWEFYTKESVSSILDACETLKSHQATFTPNKEVSVKEPSVQSLMIHQIVTQLNTKNNADALALLEKTIIAKPNLAGLDYGKALVLARLGQTDKAIETLKQLLTVMPTHQLGRRLLSNLPKN